MQDWLRFWLNKSTKSVKFDVTEDNLSVPFLTLEALAYIALKEQTKMFKSEMYNSGCLTTIVAKLDKAVLELVHSNQGVLTTTTTDSTMTTSTKLKVVERCYRILENVFCSNNIFLIYFKILRLPLLTRKIKFILCSIGIICLYSLVQNSSIIRLTSLKTFTKLIMFWENKKRKICHQLLKMIVTKFLIVFAFFVEF